jgi:uncharacterized surface protein with fasciclin (FAS1) repeats
MRITRNALHLSLALLAAVSLSACDFGEQPYETEEGENLSIRGPGERTLSGFDSDTTGTYNIFPFTIEKDYSWSIEEDGATIVDRRRENEYIDVEFSEPGTYTLNIDDGEYTGALPIEVEYRDPEIQADSLGFDALASALVAAGLSDGDPNSDPSSSDTLATGGPFTLLAPTDEAFVAAFDTSGNDAVEGGELPGMEVLADILSYHVVTDSLGTSDIAAGQEEGTLAESELTFRTNGTITVEDGTDLTDDAAFTDITNRATSGGLLHGLDDLLLPPNASVSFNDQASTDSVTVDVRSVYVPEDGYVAIHDSTLLDDPPQVAGSVIGVSEYLEAGVYNGLEITLFDVPGKDFDDDMVLEGDQLLIAMPHEETNMNEEYNFITSDGDEDGAYTEGGDPVVDPAAVAVGGGEQ